MTTIARRTVAAPSVAGTSGQPLLAVGARGASVRTLQQQLAALGFTPGPLDGKFGPQTEAAVVAFQRSRGLAPDGMVGPLTWSALGTAGRAPVPPRKPADDFVPPAPAPRVPAPPAAGAFPLVPSVSPQAEAAAANAPTSDGVPRYRQGDPAWGAVTMNDDDTLASAGCALTSVAMAVSKMSGLRIDPSQLDAQLDRTGGYMVGCDGIGDWGRLGEVVAPAVAVTREFNLSTAALDAQLAAGKPVVIGVHYTGDADTDHWMTVTSRGSDARGPFYAVNDPATGEAIKMRVDGGALVADSTTTTRAYRTTGDYVTVG